MEKQRLRMGMHSVCVDQKTVCRELVQKITDKRNQINSGALPNSLTVQLDSSV